MLKTTSWSRSVFVTTLTACFLALLSACEQKVTQNTATGRSSDLSDVVLTGLDGSHTSLGAFRGKLVILNVWATWCEPCRRELPSLENLAKLLDPDRFVVLGVSVDDDEHPVREYLIDKNVTFARYLDRGGVSIIERLGITTFPDTFIIDRKGQLVSHVVGERIWHTPQMVEVLEAAYAGNNVSIE